MDLKSKISKEKINKEKLAAIVDKMTAQALAEIEITRRSILRLASDHKAARTL